MGPLLVAVTDFRRLSMPPAQWAAAVLAGGVDIIQIREPQLGENELSRLAEAVCAVTPSPRRVQINGSISVATRFRCGLHFPERETIPDEPPRPLSRAVHSHESARRSTGCDFVVAGHIFPTPSKPGLEPRGLRWLAEIVAVSPVPVMAIGGIDRTNAAEVIRAGAPGIAVIGALASDGEPEALARDLRRIINDAWEERDDVGSTDRD